MKFITSSYGENTGESVVIMQHLGKKFKGVANFHPEDKGTKSEFAGCRYAELRAMIQAFKYERKIARDELKTIKNFIKACECYSNFDKDSTTAKTLYRQLNRKMKRINDLTKLIETLQQTLKHQIEIRDDFMNNVKELKQKREEIRKKIENLIKENKTKKDN